MLMDAMNIGFKDKTFDQVICLMAIGVDHDGVDTKLKDPNCEVMKC
jgi:hypothetical protein